MAEPIWTLPGALMALVTTSEVLRVAATVKVVPLTVTGPVKAGWCRRW